MKASYNKKVQKRKRRIERRLERRNWEEQSRPMLGRGSVRYEVAERMGGMNYGGIGVIMEMVKAVGLEKEIDHTVHVLKRHIPYHESDHVLNLAYNVLLGGERLEDIELRRQDAVYLDAVSAQRIPDPTTAGDFTRRFGEEELLRLMEAINRVRARVWALQGEGWMEDAIVDVDGTICETYGECKAGMEVSWKGIWGYAPLIVSLANTKEPLYLVNRPGNATSHEGSVEWINRAIELVRPHCRQVWLRGDTAFGLAGELDRWDEAGVRFVLGWDAQPGMVQRAQELPHKAWQALRRKRYAVKTQPRSKPENQKERIVREREYTNKRLESEQVAEFDYRPTKCRNTYRIIVVRKNLSVEKGESVLFDDERYFFYITNSSVLTPTEGVYLANERCDQENVIEQLKNGVNAMRMPVDNLQSNWAYMVMASLAWTLKAWLALFMPTSKPTDESARDEVLGMEFRRFLNSFVLLPCQVVRSARRVVYRLLGYNQWLPVLLRTFERIRKVRMRGGLAAPA